MKIQLLPVLDIVYNEGIPTPKVNPYWDHQDAWHDYRMQSLKKAGFEEALEPYFKGSTFCEPRKILANTLRKLVVDHTQEMRDGAYERNQACPLLGGYVLRINGEDKYFLQCCGDLSDITYWENVAEKKAAYYAGHPAPDYKYWFNRIIFDFTVPKYGETFDLPPPETKLKVTLRSLKRAVADAKIELNRLAERVIRINRELDLGIDRIDDLLIWENSNHG